MPTEIFWLLLLHCTLPVPVAVLQNYFSLDYLPDTQRLQLAASLHLPAVSLMS